MNLLETVLDYQCTQRLFSHILTVKRLRLGDSLKVGGLEFDFVGRVRPERASDRTIAEFMPQDRYAKASTTRLNRHGSGPFCRFKLDAVSADAGVYLIVIEGDVMYVGECQNLAERFGPRGYGSIQPKNCYVGGQSTNCKINHNFLLASVAQRKVEVWFATADSRKFHEDRIKAQLQPPWNDR